MSDTVNTSSTTSSGYSGADGIGSARILRDNDNSWARVPYQVIMGPEFVKLSDALAFTINTWGGQTKTGTYKSNNLMDLPGAHTPPEWGDLTDTEAAGGDPLLYGTPSEGMTSRCFFQDTRVGANDAINCFYQFNRDDDIVSPALYSDTTHLYGMGRVYNDTTQRNQTVAYFSFGIPVIRNLSTFLRKAVRESLARVNATGHDTSNVFNLGYIFGKVVGYVAFPMIIIPVRLFRLAANWATMFHVNKFVSLRSEMSAYFALVDSILSQWLVATGIYGNGGVNAGRYSTGKAEGEALSADEKEEQGLFYGLVKKLMPGVFSTQESLPPALAVTGPSIHDILSLRSQIIGLQYRNTPGKGDRTFAKAITKPADNEETSMKNPSDTLGADIGSVMTARSRRAEGTSTGDQADDAAATYRAWTGENLADTEDDTSSWSIWTYLKKKFKKFSTSYKFTAVGGTQFVGFRIEKGAGTSESFSNTSQPSPIGTFLNEKIKAAHKYASMAKIAKAEAAAQDDSLFGMVRSFATGLLEAAKDNFGIGSTIEAISTNSFVEIPDEYSSSDYNKSFSINFQLRALYGDPISIYESIIIPLALLLAGSLPRAAGNNSYQAPFHVKVFCPGRFSIPMGLIESLQIARGGNDFSWTYQNLPTCIDVSVSIKDLSAATYMTLRGEGVWNTLTAEDNCFTEYINTLAGVSLSDRINGVLQFQRRFQLASHQVRNKYFSIGYWSGLLGRTAIGQMSGLFISASAIPR